MQFRLAKVFPLILTAVIIAGLAIGGYYAYVMRFQLRHTVTFTEQAADVSAVDRDAIRKLIVSHGAIREVPHRLVRYRVEMNQKRFRDNSESQPIYLGKIIPNTDLVSEGFVIVEKQDDTWKIASISGGV